MPHGHIADSARAALISVLVGIALIVMGPLTYRFGLLTPRSSFLFPALGVILEIFGMLIGIRAFIVSRRGVADLMGRQALAAALLGLIALAGPVSGFLRSQRSPMIHDISTDLTNPPRFVAVVPLRSESPNPPEYAGEETAAEQRRAYPDLQPLHLSAPPQEVFVRALQVAKNLNWRIVDADPATGRIEATDRTLFYGFEDDIVIRILPDLQGGTRVDVRSKSRIGRSDLGTNARRIQKFLRKLSNWP